MTIKFCKKKKRSSIIEDTTIQIANTEMTFAESILVVGIC